MLIIETFFQLIQKSLITQHNKTSTIPGDASALRWNTVAQMVGILASLVVGMWFETIVYRAFRLMKEEMSGIPTSTTFHTLKQAQYKRTPGYVV